MEQLHSAGRKVKKLLGLAYYGSTKWESSFYRLITDRLTAKNRKWGKQRITVPGIGRPHIIKCRFNRSFERGSDRTLVACLEQKRYPTMSNFERYELQASQEHMINVRFIHSSILARFLYILKEEITIAAYLKLYCGSPLHRVRFGFECGHPFLFGMFYLVNESKSTFIQLSQYPPIPEPIIVYNYKFFCDSQQRRTNLFMCNNFLVKLVPHIVLPWFREISRLQANSRTLQKSVRTALFCSINQP